MKWPRNELQLKLKLVFKNGFAHEMWVKDLVIGADKHLEWVQCDDDNQILEFSPDEVCCIVRVGSRTKTVWE